MKTIVKTKSFWTGVSAVVSGVGFIVTGSASEGILLLFQGLGIIFLRSAVASNPPA